MNIYGIDVGKARSIAVEDLYSLCNLTAARRGIDAAIVISAVRAGLRAEVWEEDVGDPASCIDEDEPVVYVAFDVAEKQMRADDRRRGYEAVMVGMATFNHAKDVGRRVSFHVGAPPTADNLQGAADAYHEIALELTGLAARTGQ